jgi:hypothetical protein
MCRQFFLERRKNDKKTCVHFMDHLDSCSLCVVEECPATFHSYACYRYPNRPPAVTQIPPTTAPISFTAIPSSIPATAIPASLDICTDPQVTTLLASFKTAILTSDGALLGSLVNPTHGMEVRYFRNGKVVNYDQEHASFLFETTYQVNWGIAPSSGLDAVGSFHELIVPDLLKVFGQNYALKCNNIQAGGVSYNIFWPYQSDYYSAFFAGTQANGSLDWRTWVIGLEYVNGKTYIHAIMQFFWEP